jgi:hypothetical protein
VRTHGLYCGNSNSGSQEYSLLHKPRHNRHFLPGYVWHVTHRCRYLHWLFEAKKRFGLLVLNDMVTSNHGN